MRGGKRNRAVGTVTAMALAAGLVGMGSGTAIAQDGGPIAVITPPGGPFGTDYRLLVTCEEQPGVVKVIMVPVGETRVPVEVVDEGDGTWSLDETAGMTWVSFEVTCGETVETVSFQRDIPVETTTTVVSSTEPPATPPTPPAPPAAEPIAAEASYTG